MTSRGCESPPSFFALFGLEPRFALSLGRLETAYRSLARRVHPDRFVTGTEAERRNAIETATQVNEGYRTLRTPMLRALYLLDLRGIDVARQGEAASQAFLSAQFEWRAALGEARASRDEEALRALEVSAREQADALTCELADQLDSARNDAGAVAAVLQLMFFDRLLADVGDAHEALEA
ncbi:MAG: Fe-S protein assembly co-chaperone HscB [Steroidobacteraceae bacterium]|jgi:molecular chaperone HscB